MLSRAFKTCQLGTKLKVVGPVNARPDPQIPQIRQLGQSWNAIRRGGQVVELQMM